MDIHGRESEMDKSKQFEERFSKLLLFEEKPEEWEGIKEHEDRTVLVLSINV